MRNRASINRAEGFYKFLTVVGLATAVCAAALTGWSVERAQDRAFTLESEVTALSAQSTSKQAEVKNIQDYLDRMTAKVQTATDPGTPHYNFMAEEVEKATKRVELSKLELMGIGEVAATKSLQIAKINSKREKDLRFGGITAGTGIVITLVGLVLWFWRVQRFVEIETQARMTTHLVEEIVARSRTDAARARLASMECPGPQPDEMAVVTRRTMDIPAPPQYVVPVS